MADNQSLKSENESLKKDLKVMTFMLERLTERVGALEANVEEMRVKPPRLPSPPPPREPSPPPRVVEFDISPWSVPQFREAWAYGAPRCVVPSAAGGAREPWLRAFGALAPEEQSAVADFLSRQTPTGRPRTTTRSPSAMA